MTHNTELVAQIRRIKTKYGMLLSNLQETVFFIPDTMQLFTLQVSQGQPLSQIEAQLDESFEGLVATKHVNDVNKDGLHLDRRAALRPLIRGTTGSKQARFRPTLGRLTLNISNTCNLWCSYCYADHGLYHAPKSLMPATRATSIVTKVLDLYSGVNVAHFFGGEPLMNLPAIHAVANTFESAAQKGLIKQLPRFVATTNGTLASAAVLATLREWAIELTVSWDGPKEVHDAGRPMNNQESSYNHLIETIHHFEACNITYDIECTYKSGAAESPGRSRGD
jgi:sulfatase maturation enzyme AslB (radical SAM superfamily)